MSAASGGHICRGAVPAPQTLCAGLPPSAACCRLLPPGATTLLAPSLSSLGCRPACAHLPGPFPCLLRAGFMRRLRPSNSSRRHTASTCRCAELASCRAAYGGLASPITIPVAPSLRLKSDFTQPRSAAPPAAAFLALQVMSYGYLQQRAELIELACTIGAQLALPGKRQRCCVCCAAAACSASVAFQCCLLCCSFFCFLVSSCFGAGGK